MKRLLLISLLMLCFAIPHCAFAESEDSFLNSAGKFFGDAWNSAGELWNDASNAAGEAWDAVEIKSARHGLTSAALLLMHGARLAFILAKRAMNFPSG